MVLIVMALAMAGWYYQDRRKHLLNEQLQVLSIVSLSKANAVGAWRKERLNDARLLSENRIFCDALAKFVDAPGMKSSGGELDEWLRSLRKNYGYLHSTLLDKDLHVVAGDGSGEGEIGPLTRQYARESLESGSLVYVDFHTGVHYRAVHLDLIIPLHKFQGKSRSPVGSLVLRIDPAPELYPLIASWPTPSTSAESILVRREGNGVVYLSPSRHGQQDRALTRASVRDGKLSAVLDAGKSDAIFETIGFDGTPVFMDVKHVPDSPWILITKIDRDELYGPIRKEAWRVALMAAALIFSAGIGIGLLRRRRSDLYARAEERANSERKRAEMAIREGERRLATLISNLAGIVYRCRNDRDWTMEFVSEGCREIVGYSPADIMSGPVKWGDLIVAEDRQRVWDDVQDALAENRPYQMVFRLHDAAGNLKWVWEKGSGVFDENGTLLALEGFIMDVSERIWSEQALRESERKYRRLFEDAVLGVFQTTADGRVLSANPAYVRMFGFDSLEELHAHVTDIANDLYCDPRQREEVLQLMTESPGLATFEIPFRRKDRSTFIGNLHIRMVRDAEGKLVVLEGFVEDITEKKKIAERIARSEHKFRAIFESARDAIFLISGNALYVDCNPVAAEIFGCSREDLLEMKPHTFSPEMQPDGKSSTEKAEEVMAAALKGEPQRFEWLHERPDGTRFDAVVAMNRFQFEGEQMLLAIVRDVSDRKRMERELRSSEARFRELSDMLPEVIFESDLSGKLTYANKDAFAKYGYAEHELAEGIFIHQLVVPGDRPRLAAAMADKVSGRKTDPYGGEYTTLRKDGTTLPVIVYSKPIVQDGLPIGLRGIVVDITEQKAFETQIKAQAAQLRAIMDHLPFDFWAIGADGRYYYQNSRSRDIWGCFVGKLPEEVAPSAEMAELWRDNNRRAFAGEVVKGHVEYHAENGIRTCINILAPMLDGNSVLGIIGANIDITDQKRAEEQIRFQVSLLDQVRNAVIAADLEGRVVYWNRYAEVLYQWTGAEAMGQNLRDLLIPQESREHYRTVTEKLAADGSWEGEIVVRKKDGSRFTIFMTTTTLADKNGNRTGYVGISVDISERLRLEEQLLHAQKMEAVGRLAGGVAHDFNNILTAILGYGQMLHDRQASESLDLKYAEIILSSAEKAAELTRSLLAFSRKEIINPKLIDLNDVIRKITHLLSRLIGEDIELRTDLLDASLVVMADGGQIEQVLMNLATNARDAMPGGGKIVITTDMEYLDPASASLLGSGNPGYYVRVSFSDNGIGIPEDAREKIFDPFFTTKEQGKGTGLGLSIVHGIVMQHSGCIRLDSMHGNGTTFHIYLPSAREEAVEGAAVSMKSAVGGDETILLAEDDEILRELNRDILEAYGYRVIVAADGQEAVDRFVENRDEIRLLMLDVIMPRKNGGAVYAEIAAMSRDIKVLFASGYAADILPNGVSVDGMNFIPKPMTPYDLLSKVRDVLDCA
jgi:PAS domain S-box-containing protein